MGWQARMHQQNAPETSALLTSCTQDAVGYLSNADRFHTDTVGEEYALRQQALQRRYQANEYRRNQSFKRDEDRWNQNEEKQQKEDEAWRKLREDGSKAKKNQSAVAYDIMTLQYSQDVDGQHQKYQDDMGKFASELQFSVWCDQYSPHFPFLFFVISFLCSAISCSTKNKYACR